jgi:hypothetical protein
MTTMRDRTSAMLRRALVVMAVCAPGAAHADEWSLHLLGNGMAAWTDNVFSAPDEPVIEGAPEREADFYYQVRPGALFSYETPRMVHELGYDLEANFYQDHGDAGSLTHRVGWRGFFLTSPNTEVNTSASFSTGDINSLISRNQANQGGQATLPGGNVEFVQADVTEHFSLQVTRPLRLTQGALARRFETKDDFNTTSTGMEIGGSLGVDRAWRDDSLGLVLSTTFVQLERRTPETVPDDDPSAYDVAGDDSMNLQAVVSWRRDLGRHWSSVIDGGVTALVPLDEGDELVLQPTVGGQLAYFPDWGSASLQVRRSVAPNLYLAQNTITDAAILSAWLPLPWLTSDPALPRLTFMASGGAQRTQIIDLENGEIADGLVMLTGDVAVAYTPMNAIAFSVRYQHIRQNADDMTLLPMQTNFDYTRNTVMITAYARWPDRLAGEIPQRESLRVDRSDTTAVGEETNATPEGERQR